FRHHPSTPRLYTLSLHDALPISCSPSPRRSGRGYPCSTPRVVWCARCWRTTHGGGTRRPGTSSSTRHTSPRRSCSRPPDNCALRSEEHTSELQSRENLVCRLLLE